MRHPALSVILLGLKDAWYFSLAAMASSILITSTISIILMFWTCSFLHSNSPRENLHGLEFILNLHHWQARNHLLDLRRCQLAL